MTYNKFKARASHIFIEDAKTKTSPNNPEFVVKTPLFDKIVAAAYFAALEAVEDERQLESHKRR